MQQQYILTILAFLQNHRGFDFSGYRKSMLERRIHRRIRLTQNTSYTSYLDYLKKHDEELDFLLDALTIKVSHFFRDPFVFEYVNTFILPLLVANKTKEKDRTLRIWSAGCAQGEEAFSIALLVNELLNRDAVDIKPSIFATDIDQMALKKAQKATYPPLRLENLKLGMLNKYFTEVKNGYALAPQITEQVQFSFYDLLDEQILVPPESIYGGFDLVLCRNVLIYFQQRQQDFIFKKLFRSLKKGGYLILGESEMLSKDLQPYFNKIQARCKIYQKSSA